MDNVTEQQQPQTRGAGREVRIILPGSPTVAGPARSRASRRQRLGVLCTAALCLLDMLQAPPPAAAATPDRCQADKDCKAMTERASQFAAQTRYEEALSIYQAAYDISKEPRVLVNIGRCQYRLGRSRKALDAYKKFQIAQFEPEPELQARVGQFIEEAERAIAADRPDGPDPTPQTAAPAAQAATTAPLFVPKDAPSVEPPPSVLSASSSTAASQGRPAWRLGLGIGLAALGLAATGLGAAAISVHGSCATPLDTNPSQCTPMTDPDGNRTISVLNGLAPGIPLLVGGIVFTVGGIALAAAPPRRTAEQSPGGSQ